MAFGNIVAPPPALAVQEVKDLIALISDPKKAAKYLEQIEEASKSTAEFVKGQADKSAEIQEGLKALAAQEDSLAKREIEAAAILKDAKAMVLDMDQRESAISLGEKELQAKQSAFSAEYKKVMGELSLKLSDAKKAEAIALSVKAESEEIIKNYNDKLASIKNAIGN